MARQAELEKSKSSSNALSSIQQTAEKTLKLIDSYLLISLNEYGQTSLPLESVGIGSIIYDVAQDMRGYARNQDVDIEYTVNDANVMANVEGLKAAIWCLSDMAINQSSLSDNSRGRISITTKKTNEKIKVSVLSNNMEVKNSDLHRARKQFGSSHHAFSSSSPDSGVRLALADMLSSALGSQLSAAKSNHMQGLSFDLLRSQQLQLV